MLLIVLGLIVISIVIVWYVNSNGKSNLNIEDDYNHIKEALKKYKQKNIAKNIDMNELKSYLTNSDALDWSRYAISDDSKYLIVKRVSKKEKMEFVKIIDVPYKIKDDNLYLGFVKTFSKVGPKAVISMVPSEEVLTTTTIKWDYENSVCEGGEIINSQWKNKQERYENPGSYTVSLRVQDKNGNWSDWETKIFKVKERKGIKDIKIRLNSVYVIKNNGKVKVLGDNTNGQLGIDLDFNPPELVESEKLKNIFEIAAGKDYAIMLTNEKKIYGIGRNHRGQLGTGTQINALEPIEIKGVPDPTHVATGEYFSGAVTSQGNVYLWGSNKNGQLGCNDPSNKLLPLKLDKVRNVKQISLGYSHGLALCYDGSIFAWGSNVNGQLGLGIKDKCSDPVITTGIQNAACVCAGRDFSLAVTPEGKVYGWGKNDLGQLASESHLDVLFPTEIKSIREVDYISAAESFVLALKKDGTVWTWGTTVNDDGIKQTITTPEKIKDIKYIKRIDAGNKKGLLLTTEDDIVILNAGMKEEVLFSV